MTDHSKPKHTAGPWHVTNGGFITGKDAGEEIAVTRANIRGHEPQWAERNANANLIATAPEMLEALERMNKLFSRMMAKIPHGDTAWSGEDIMEMNDAPIQATRLIAKAKGE